MVYKDGVVTVQLIGEDRVLLELPGIRVMQVYNRPQGFLTFKGSASKPFRGCGKTHPPLSLSVNKTYVHESSPYI